MADDKCVVELRENGPILVKNLRHLILPDGSEGETKPVMALCRCGASSKKPFCDGSHNDIGFSDAAVDPASQDRTYTFTGKAATVHWNSLLCSHAAECVKRLPNVFDPKQRPWIEPDKADAATLSEVVSACPSGALRLSRAVDAPTSSEDNSVEITVEANGPYRVSGIATPAGYHAKGMDPKKYVLCRCGLSGNKPFCDGTHADKGWKAD